MRQRAPASGCISLPNGKGETYGKNTNNIAIDESFNILQVLDPLTSIRCSNFTQLTAIARIITINCKDSRLKISRIARLLISIIKIYGVHAILLL